MGHAYVKLTRLFPCITGYYYCRTLRANGCITTGMFGKWGLEGETRTNQFSTQLKGFDAFFGYLNQTHAHDYFTDHLVEISKAK